LHRCDLLRGEHILTLRSAVTWCTGIARAGCGYRVSHGFMH